MPSPGIAGRIWPAFGLLLALLSLALARAGAFEGDDEARRDGTDLEVVIKREALKLTDPRTYRASLHLDATRTVELTSPVDGYVRGVTAKPGQKIKAQGEAVRLDDTRAALVLKRARANLQAAQVEKKLAQAKSDADLVALAEAHLEAAQADLDLAQFEADRLVVRPPLSGDVVRVHVVEGEFVRAGDKLATVVDASRLQVEVPVERGEAAPGGTIGIKVEEAAVKARVDAVMPLAERFDSLRELTVSPASALVSIDNSAGKFSTGQTVYSELIPLMPVALVPTNSVSNASGGDRKVQVLREYVVRDLPVRILSKVGTESVFVSGRFNEGDEVIVYSSRELADGTPLRALAAASSSGNEASARGAARPGTGNKSGTSAKKPTEGF